MIRVMNPQSLPIDTAGIVLLSYSGLNANYDGRTWLTSANLNFRWCNQNCDFILTLYNLENKEVVIDLKYGVFDSQFDFEELLISQVSVTNIGVTLSGKFMVAVTSRHSILVTSLNLISS